MRVIIVGAGIGGLTLALCLHDAGIGCRVYEAAAQIRPLGVGVNLLPHATKHLARLGLLDALAQVAVTTREQIFFNRFGQYIYSEPTGRFAGFEHPQLSIHRGDLQTVLLRAVRERLGDDAVVAGHRCTGIEQRGDTVLAQFVDPADTPLPPAVSRVLVGCDGIHSVVRRQFYPDEGPPRYSGVNMWRGVTIGEPFLTGASMVRAGWLSVGKMVIYPIRDDVDGHGRQLINWVAEIESPQPVRRDWNRAGRLEDFFPAFADWHFDWLDVAELIRRAESVLEYPMVDQDPLPTWTFGGATLLGDAAHPMVPRGSNGAGQAILDAGYLADCLRRHGVGEPALRDYDQVRVAATTQVVLMNRRDPPDAILREVHLRSGDRPFERIEDLIGVDEMAAITGRYRQVAGVGDPTRR